MFGLSDAVDDITGKAKGKGKRGKSFKRGLGFGFHRIGVTPFIHQFPKWTRPVISE